MHLIQEIYTNVLKSIKDKITYDAFILMFFNACRDVVNAYEAVLVDETDFFLIQANKSTMTRTNEREFLDKVDTIFGSPTVDGLIELFFRALAGSNSLAISISANPLYIPPRFYDKLQEYNYDGHKDIINTIKVNLKSNLRLNSLAIVESNNVVRDSIKMHNYIIRTKDNYTFFY
jgi:hypothetical protein